MLPQRFLPNPKSKIGNPKSLLPRASRLLDRLIRPLEQAGWNGQTKRFHILPETRLVPTMTETLRESQPSIAAGSSRFTAANKKHGACAGKIDGLFE
jgi:hypothetical protein